MNRRDLLKYLLATPLAATLDVEKLLWVPKPMVVVPAIAPISFQLVWREWGSNVLVTDYSIFGKLKNFPQLLDIIKFEGKTVSFSGFFDQP